MIYFLIPIYNEAQNIVNLRNNFIKLKFEEKIKILFIDDFSNDESVNLLNYYFKNFNYKIINKDKNKGPGDSFNLGFEWVLKDSNNLNDLIVTMEADNTSSFNILFEMLSICKLGFSIVLASPYCQGGGFKKTNLFKKTLSFFANMLMRTLFSLKLRTLSSFYRIYDIKIIRKIKEKYGNIVTQNGFVSMIEILIKAIKCNARVIEVPMILESGNRIGKSKMKILKTIIEYLKFLFLYAHKI